MSGRPIRSWPAGCLFLAAMLGAWLPAAEAAAATLEVTVLGIRNDRGHIRIGICRKSQFLSEACDYHAVVASRAGSISAAFDGIAPGQYAVAAYQDVDDSGKLKRNFFGMPKEDLGFSRNPSLGMGPPSFAQSAIMLGNSNERIALTLHHFGS